MDGKRAILRVQLDGASKSDLDRICEKRGMTQIAVMSRLVGWFVRQDDFVQTAVMSSLSDDTLSQMAKQMLKTLASDRTKVRADDNHQLHNFTANRKNTHASNR